MLLGINELISDNKFLLIAISYMILSLSLNDNKSLYLKAVL